MKLNRTAARVIDIIQLLATSNKPLTQLEISKSLDIPKSSTFDLIYTLLQKKIVEFDNEEFKTFKLGIQLFEIGTSILSKIDFMDIARKYLEEISNKTGKTVFLAMESEGQIVYLQRVENNPFIIGAANVGMRLPMYCTALGKAILSTYSEEKIRIIWNHSDIKKYTPYTITSYDKLLENLKLTKKRGYALEYHELLEESCCVSAPIIGYDGQAVAAISLGFISNKLNMEQIDEFANLLVDAAESISKNIGALVKNKR